MRHTLRCISYDILAFDPAATSDEDFPQWWAQQSEWGESHGYDDASMTTPALAAFYAELVQTFPDLNGSGAANPTNSARVTDYSIGTSLVYAAFACSQAEAARAAFLEAAQRHGVAVALVSDDDSIIRPE